VSTPASAPDPSLAPADDPHHRLQLPPGAELDPDVRALIDEKLAIESRALAGWGTLKPQGFLRFFAYFETAFDPEQGVLSLVDREILAAVVSATNRCTGCSLVHTRRLGEALEDHSLAQRIALNHRHVPLSPRHRALADYAVRATVTPWEISDADLQSLRDVGLDEEAVFEAIEIVALFNLTNRIASGIASHPDPDFYLPEEATADAR
jgi:uncharacterized peroxidase-related enzyme